MNREANPSSTADPDAIFVPLFTTANFAEMEIITDIFEEEDIAYLIRRRQMSAFWTTVGDHDQIRVYVEPAGVEKAVSFIEQALADNAIPGDGNFIDTERRQELKRARKELEQEAREAEKQAKKAEKKADKQAKKAEKKRKKAEKQRKKADKQARKQEKSDVRNRKKADKLDKQAQRHDKKAHKAEQKAEKHRKKAEKKRDKASKKRPED